MNYVNGDVKSRESIDLLKEEIVTPVVSADQEAGGDI
jgi:hypothetical protein